MIIETPDHSQVTALLSQQHVAGILRAYKSRHDALSHDPRIAQVTIFKRAAVAKFAAGGKPGPKKDLGLMAMSYGNVYVASVAMGAKDEHTIKALLEAEAYDGPSLIIAYSHCIVHGINMTTAMSDQKTLVDSGQWLPYRYNPERLLTGENPLILDSRTPSKKVKDVLLQQTRFKMLTKSSPEDAKRLWQQAQHDAEIRYRMYEYLAQRKTQQPAAADAPVDVKTELQTTKV